MATDLLILESNTEKIRRARVLSCTAGSALTAAAVEQRLWPAAVGYLVTVAIASVWPAIAWPVESVANLLLTINVLVIWRGERRAA